MIAMSPTMTLRGAVKFSVRKLLAGGELASSTFVGPGELLLAPASLGDVAVLRLASPVSAASAASSSSPSAAAGRASGTTDSGASTTTQRKWSIGRDAFLACTQGVSRECRAQGVGKALFSGEGLFVYRLSGAGLVWVTSFGAIVRKEVRFAFCVLRFARARARRFVPPSPSLFPWLPSWLRVSLSILLSGARRREGDQQSTTRHHCHPPLLASATRTHARR